jgi:hypothetical protein
VLFAAQKREKQKAIGFRKQIEGPGVFSCLGLGFSCLRS